MGSRHFAHDKERSLDAFCGKLIQNFIGVRRNRSIVEGENHLVVLKRQGLLVLNRAEPLELGRIERDHPACAERVRVPRAFAGYCRAREGQKG